jgi:hypothetical protein
MRRRTTLLASHPLGREAHIGGRARAVEGKGAIVGGRDVYKRQRSSRWLPAPTNRRTIYTLSPESPQDKVAEGVLPTLPISEALDPSRLAATARFAEAPPGRAVNSSSTTEGVYFR